MNLKPSVRLFYIIFLQFSCLSASFAQTISAKLIATDRRSGVQINPEFSVVKLPENTTVKIASSGFERSISVRTGEKIRIKATLDGYYPDERTYTIDDNFSSDGRNIVFDLDPQPSATVNFTVRDKVSGKKIPSIAKFIVDGKVVKTVESGSNGDYPAVVLTQPGEYTVEVAAGEYEIQRKNATIVVNDPPEKFSLDIQLGQTDKVFSIKTVDASSMSPILGVNLRVSNVKGKSMYNAVTAKDVTEIDPLKEQELMVEAEMAGFERFKQTVSMITSSLTIELKPLSLVSVSTFDKSANEQIAAVVVFTSPNGKVINVKTTRQGKVIFTPDVKGNYAYQVTNDGFQPIKGELVIDQTTGKKFDVKIDLLTEIRTLPIAVVDENGARIPSASLSITNQQNSGQILERSNDGWVLRLNKGDKYKYVASADGYRKSDGELQFSPKLTEVAIVLSKAVVAQIKAIDKYTEKPVKSTVSYNGVNSEPAFEHNLSIGSGSVAKPVIKAAGYEDYQVDAINTKTMATVLMLADKYPVTFTFINLTDGKPISPDSFVIKNVASDSAVEGKGNFVFDLAAEQKYNFTVKKNKFISESAEFVPSSFLTKNNFQKVIELRPLEKAWQAIKIVDNETGEPIVTNQVEVIDNSGQKVAIRDENNSILAAVEADEPFTVNVNAVGYVPISKKFNKPANQGVEVRLMVMKKVVEATTAIIFEAFDEILERTVPAKFTLISGETMKDLPTFDKGIHAKAEVAEGKEFTIRISAPDYQDKEKAFVAKNLTNTQRITFRRTFYPVKFIVKPENSDLAIAAARIKINGDGQKISTSYQPSLTTFNGEFKPGQAYSVSIEADGFEPITQMVKLSDIVRQDLTKTFVMKQMGVTKLEKVPEPVVVAEVKKDSVIATPKPVKIETVYEQNKENLADIPTSSVEMLETLSDKTAIGRRYILTKVYFSQSTPTMKPESDEQLAQILKVMRSNDKIKVELVGHTDNVGDPRQNDYLSKYRAKVISSFLFNNGITDDRIIIKGMGDKFPVEPNDTEENKSKNRRVELIVIEN